MALQHLNSWALRYDKHHSEQSNSFHNAGDLRPSGLRLTFSEFSGPGWGIKIIEPWRSWSISACFWNCFLGQTFSWRSTRVLERVGKPQMAAQSRLYYFHFLSLVSVCRTGTNSCILQILSLGPRFFFSRSVVSEQTIYTYLFVDRCYDSEGHFGWPAWWIEFTSRFKLRIF